MRRPIQDGGNGSGRRVHARPYMNTARASDLAASGVPAPPDSHIPKGWHLDLDGVPVPPPPTGPARAMAIAELRFRLPSPALRANPKYGTRSPYWDKLFEREHEAKRRSSRFDRTPRRWNTAARRQIWAEAPADEVNVASPAHQEVHELEDELEGLEAMMRASLEPEVECDGFEEMIVMRASVEPVVKPDHKVELDSMEERSRSVIENAVKNGLGTFDSSSSVDWSTVAAGIDAMEEILSATPKQGEPGDDPFWPGTKAELRNSVGDVVIVLD